MEEVHLQRNQPDGVPPLALTGERTLPDVPEENYWYRRHLAVYEWIAARVGGLRVADLACGEGYGSDVLARDAAEVVGVDANPEAHEHATLRYRRPNLRFERDLVEAYAGPCDAIVFLQTIEHIDDPGALLDGFARVAAAQLRRRPRTGSRSPPTAPRSRTTPGTCASTRSPSTGRCWSRALPRSSCSASSTPASCACTSSRSGPAGTASTPRCGSRSPSTTASCPRSPPPTSPSGRPRNATSTAPSTSSPSAGVSADGRVGDLALVLHSHMPYVEGYGTYPFGEEWLFDAVIRSYVPVCAVAERVHAHRHAGARRSARGSRGCRAAARVPARRTGSARATPTWGTSSRPTARRAGPRPTVTRGALARLEACDGDLLRLFAEPARAGRVELLASAATHAVLPLVATARGPPRCRSTPGCARIGGASASRTGSGCPSAPTSPASSGCSPSAACATSAPIRARRTAPLAALAPVAAARRDRRLRDRLGGGRAGCGPSTAIPPTRCTPTSTASRCAERARGRSAASPYDAGRGDRARPRAGARVRRCGRGAAASAIAAERGRAGLIVFAIDTELLGHWWWEGPAWLEEVLATARRARGGAGHAWRGPASATSRSARELRRSSWGEGKDLRTWDSPQVADLACGRSPARAAAAARAGRRAWSRESPSAPRASCSRVQASDWAFLDQRRQAGDYPWQRDHGPCARVARGHKLAPPRPASRRVRNLAPDLSLSPLLEP